MLWGGSITSNDEVGTQPRHHTVGDLPGCGGELHVATADALPRMGGHGRSCMGRRSDEEVVRPWYRKDRQGIGRAVDHTHQALPCDHAVGIVHILLLAYHKIHEAGSVGGNRRVGDCSHAGDRGGHSSHHKERVGIPHRRGDPSASESGTYHDRDHLVRQGLRGEPWA
jgi:hypothetical protein